MNQNPEKLNKSFQELCSIIAKLRDPKDGCPWDIKQTHSSLKPYLIEEAYELIEAIDESPSQIKNELGDVLLQVMLHAQIASDAKNFSIIDVIDLLNKKLIERHPHVFDDKKLQSAEEVAQNWTKSKQKNNSQASILGDIPKALPGLLKAKLLGSRAGAVGFDWPDVSGVIEKVTEELDEVKLALQQKQTEHVLEELGDLLFASAQLARKLNANPEELLQKACKKFTDRFIKMEANAKNGLETLTSQELEALWKLSKS